MSESKKAERIGSVGTNKYGSKMIVVEYNSTTDIWVEFVENGNKQHTRWRNFSIGSVENPYDKTVFGIGYIGEGEYEACIKRKFTNQYISWSSMMARCYSEYFHKRQPAYIDCSVVEEWHCFQNFAKWYNQNFYEVEGQRMQLDKDILVKGNRVYSPETCVFVPHSINSLFVKVDARRGNLPVGVCCYENKNINKYGVRCRDGKGKYANVGYFSTAEEAFHKYKLFKESVIKETANKYKNKIPEKLYVALLKYQVEITD
jgi:hypothetical protein